MHIVEGILIGISAIRSNKMRSLLTMLGIIIGVAAVLAMIAIGDGAKEIVVQDAQKLGRCESSSPCIVRGTSG